MPPLWTVLVVTTFGCLLSLDLLGTFAINPCDGAVASSSALALPRRGRGRPKKFSEPSRSVTLTLPESALTALSAIHADISQAIVRLVGRQGGNGRRKAADLIVFGRRAVITIRPTRSLELRAGVQLVPLPDGRALISYDAPTSLAALQLSLADALEDRTLDKEDRAVYESLSDILRDARRSAEVTVNQRHIIVLESRRARSASFPNPDTRKVSGIK
jgi:hypothetical protein